MRKSQILLAISLCLLVFLSSSFLLVFSQVHAQDEEEWDFEGVIRVKSDYVQVTTFDPKENGYNESVGDYSRPTLFTYVVGFDTDDDIRFDTYVAFYGFHMYDVSAYNYTTNKDLFKFVINSRWKLRIPKESPQHWQILYYPDPTYVQLAQNLAEKAPILFVNLTATVGCNLEYQIDFGRNATVGNFTTFGPGKPLVPSLPDFPGYNVSVPLFTDNIIIGANVKSDFFGGPISFVAIVVLSFSSYYIIRKRFRK